MLPLPSFEGSVPEFSTDLSLENLFDELFNGIGAPTEELHGSSTVIPSSIPPRDILPLPSSFEHPLQEQAMAYIRNSSPVRIRNSSRSVAQNPTMLCPIKSIARNNFLIDDENLDVSGLAEIAELEHLDYPLPEPRFDSSFLGNRVPVEEARGGLEQMLPKETNFENHPQRIVPQAKPSKLNYAGFTQNREPEEMLQYPNPPSERTSGQYVSFYGPGNQSVLEASLARISQSRHFHARPSGENSGRPAKRQRRIEGISPTEVIPSLSRPAFTPTSGVDQRTIHGGIKNSNQGQLFPMPFVEDADIQRDMIVNDKEHELKPATNDSTVKQGTAVRTENAIRYGKKTLNGTFLQPACSARSTQGIPERHGSIQIPSHLATIRNDEGNLNSILPHHSPFSANGIVGHFSDGVTESEITKPIDLNEVQSLATKSPAPISLGEHAFRQDLTLPIPGEEHRNSIETPSSDYINDDSMRRSLNSSEFSRLQIPKENVEPKNRQYPEEAATDPSEQFSSDLRPTRVKIDSHYVIMRLENPPHCETCGKQYTTEESLEKHIRTAHGAPAPTVYKCSACKATFKNDTNLRRHRHEAHGTQAFSCDICNVGFSKKRALVLHQKKLHGVMPSSVKRKRKMKKSFSSPIEKKALIYYECLFCMYSSTVKGNVVRHLNGKHLDKRPYQCQFCGKQGKTKQNITFHVQVCPRRGEGASDVNQANDSSSKL